MKYLYVNNGEGIFNDRIKISSSDAKKLIAIDLDGDGANDLLRMQEYEIGYWNNKTILKAKN